MVDESEVNFISRFIYCFLNGLHAEMDNASFNRIIAKSLCIPIFCLSTSLYLLCLYVFPRTSELTQQIKCLFPSVY